MFGALASFPWTFGDTTDEPQEVEYHALLDGMRDVLDPTTDTAHEIETWAQSLAVAVIWEVSERLANQAFPAKMLEALAMWETVLKLTPSADDTEADRRGRVAAKLRGLGNNALPDIEATASAVLGAAFVEVIVGEPDDQITYWPGGGDVGSNGGGSAPGPPGFEWCSTRALVGVRMSKAGLTDAQFIAKRAALIQALDALIPSWMSYVVGVGSEWVVGVGIVGQTII
jgi:hypothetical protein